MSIKKQYTTENIDGEFFSYVVEKEGLVIVDVTVMKKNEFGSYEVVMQVPPGWVYRLLEELPEVMREVDVDYQLNMESMKKTQGGEPQ